MYYVLRRTPTTSGSGYTPRYTPTVSPDGYPLPPTQPKVDRQPVTFTETRIGRRFVHIEPAKALAKRHLGRVIDLNSRREVANYA